MFRCSVAFDPPTALTDLRPLSPGYLYPLPHPRSTSLVMPLILSPPPPTPHPPSPFFFRARVESHSFPSARKPFSFYVRSSARENADSPPPPPTNPPSKLLYVLRGHDPRPSHHPLRSREADLVSIIATPTCRFAGGICRLLAKLLFRAFLISFFLSDDFLSLEHVCR